VRWSGGEALVPVVQAADLGSRDALAHGWRVSLSRVGRVLAQRQMRPCPVIAGEIRFQDFVKMAFTEDDDMVETLPPHGSHEAFSKRILPRRPRCGETFFDANALDATTELGAEDAVAVADHEPGRGVLGERLDDLLGGPGRAGMLGDVEVQNAAAVVGPRRRRHGEPERSQWAP